MIQKGKAHGGPDKSPQPSCYGDVQGISSFIYEPADIFSPHCKALACTNPTQSPAQCSLAPRFLHPLPQALHSPYIFTPTYSHLTPQGSFLPIRLQTHYPLANLQLPTLAPKILTRIWPPYTTHTLLSKLHCHKHPSDLQSPFNTQANSTPNHAPPSLHTSFVSN